MNPAINALIFLINAGFGLYILLLVLRFLLVFTRDPMRSPPALLVVKLTRMPLVFLYSFIPRIKNIDLAALLLIFMSEFIKLLLTFWLYGQKLSLLGLIFLSVVNIVYFFIYFYMFSIIIQAILSFVAASNDDYRHNPISEFLGRLNQPLLTPIRNVVKPMNGFDFSPLIAILSLQLLIILVVDPLAQIFKSLMI
jgi:YggT family protein